jgi:hypothetical protein
MARNFLYWAIACLSLLVITQFGIVRSIPPRNVPSNTTGLGHLSERPLLITGKMPESLFGQVLTSSSCVSIMGLHSV